MSIKEEKIDNLIAACDKLIAHLDIVLGDIKLSATSYLYKRVKEALAELNEGK